MKKYVIKASLVLLILVSSVSTIFAGYVSGYYYYINGNTYTVGGGTYHPDYYSSYIRSETFSTVQSGSWITFQRLELNTRVFQNTAGCPKSIYDARTRNCDNCTYTHINNMVPPSGNVLSNYVATSRHKLQDTRATNSNGNPPSPFYSKGSANGPASWSYYQGYIWGC